MNIQSLLEWFIRLLGEVVFPVLITLAVLFFLINVVRYFIIGGANEESQQKAKTLALWGIIAFVIISGFWGIVAILNRTFDLDGIRSIIPDYQCEKMREKDPTINCVEEQSILDETSGTGDGDLGDIPFTG